VSLSNKDLDSELKCTSWLTHHMC